MRYTRTAILLIHQGTETLGLAAFSGQFHYGGMPQDLALKSLRLFAEKVPV